MLAAGRTDWAPGERARVYRARSGAAGLVQDREDDESATATVDPRDYDTDHYERVLRDNFASRLARAFTPDDFAIVFADPDQLEMFGKPLASISTVLVKGSDTT